MPAKYERKLQQAGQSSLAVVIPKSWIRFNALKASDKVVVITNDEIVIRPKEEEEAGVNDR